MRLVTFVIASGVGPLERTGALVEKGSAIVDLEVCATGLLQSRGATPDRAAAIAKAAFGDMRSVIATGEWGLELAREALDQMPSEAAPEFGIFEVDEVSLRAPLRPRSLRDCNSFEDHVRRVVKVTGGTDIPSAWYESPVYYKGNPTTVVGPHEQVTWPHYSKEMDYELELAVVVAPGGSDIPEARCEDQIYGVTIFNDFSARDVQFKEMSVGLGPAKGKDFANSLGPSLVTRDEIKDLYDLEMVARVNNVEWSRGNSGSMHWSWSSMIHHISLAEQLGAGDVIGSGTVGSGCGLELGRRLQSGDTVELEVEGIGVLRNRVDMASGDDADARAKTDT